MIRSYRIVILIVLLWVGTGSIAMAILTAWTHRQGGVTPYFLFPSPVYYDPQLSLFWISRREGWTDLVQVQKSPFMSVYPSPGATIPLSAYYDHEKEVPQWIRHLVRARSSGSVLAIQAGLPLRYLRGDLLFTDASIEHRGVVETGQNGNVMPFRPIPLAVLLNTILLGWPAPTLTIILWYIRYRIRAARNLCQGCGYPHSQSTICPECGRTRVSSS